MADMSQKLNVQITCINNKLHKLVTNTSYPIHCRKILSTSTDEISPIEELVKEIKTAIKRSTEKNDSFLKFRQTILNAPCHVFRKHDNFGDFCKKKSENSPTKKELLKSCGLWTAIYKILDPIIQKGANLTYNETINQAERFMALVAKCIKEKRIHFSKRLSYTVRT